MNHGPLIFLGAFASLAASWYGIVFTGLEQIGRQEPVKIEATGSLYPGNRPGRAAQGAEVYRAQGCYYCHSQQISIDRTVIDVSLTAIGTNPPVVLKALEKALPNLKGDALTKATRSLPLALVSGADSKRAAALKELFKDSGATISMVLVNQGSDITRGWAPRQTVAQDFIYDKHVLLGAQRIGPDLSSVGSRPVSADYHFAHLYNPKTFSQESTMPAYRYLFTKRKIVNGHRSPEALKPGISKLLGIEPDYEVIPKDEARELVAYLMSLRIETPLLEAPMQPPAPPAAQTVAAAAPAVATPSPAK